MCRALAACGKRTISNTMDLMPSDDEHEDERTQYYAPGEFLFSTAEHGNQPRMTDADIRQGLRRRVAIKKDGTDQWIECLSLQHAADHIKEVEGVAEGVGTSQLSRALNKGRMFYGWHVQDW